MRILFSLYQENRETGDKAFLFDKVVETHLKIQEIDDLMQLNEGFRSVLVVGENLCFWDIYSLIENEEEIKNAILKVPNSYDKKIPHTSPKVFVIEEFDPGNSDGFFYPDEETCFAYRMERYECGASGFDLIVLWAANNPVHMIFIGGFIWDMTKRVGIKIYRKLCGAFRSGDGEKISLGKKKLYFNSGKFYKNFEKITNIPKFNCQIVFLECKDDCIYEIHVRTIKNEKFITTCHINGKILSLNKKGK